MAYFNAEPQHPHGTPAKVGILLLNLGTPDAPTGKALRPYLKQFLSDRRVVEIPRAIWWLILNGIILNLRPKKSAEKYALVWTKEGSPLLVNGLRQAKMLQGFLRVKLNQALPVELGMSYGNPSTASAIEKLRAQNCDRILVLPLYPQYAASSTASAFDAVFNVLMRTRNMPAIRTIRSYHDHPAYIQALAESIREYWRRNGQPNKLVMSFHGVPKYTLDKGDPYHCTCHKTGRLLAEALQLDASQYMVCFQSRFGKAEWIKPYLSQSLEELGKQKTGRVDVVCPGFSSDCLETLEEIAIEGKQAYLSAGGTEYHYIPCLNDREGWIHALVDIVEPHLQGWINPDYDQAAEQIELQASKARAIAMGAKA